MRAKSKLYSVWCKLHPVTEESHETPVAEEDNNGILSTILKQANATRIVFMNQSTTVSQILKIIDDFAHIEMVDRKVDLLKYWAEKNSKCLHCMSLLALSMLHQLRKLALNVCFPVSGLYFLH